jgi:hypothetical protein
MRPKIAWLAFGQSSVYQAETISPTNDYWFYSFNQSIGASVPDWQFNNGGMVLHCSDAESGPAGYVLKRLKANTEQCRRAVGNPPDNVNHWEADSECGG